MSFNSPTAAKRYMVHSIGWEHCQVDTVPGTTIPHNCVFHCDHLDKRHRCGWESACQSHDIWLLHCDVLPHNLTFDPPTCLLIPLGLTAYLQWRSMLLIRYCPPPSRKEASNDLLDPLMALFSKEGGVVRRGHFLRCLSKLRGGYRMGEPYGLIGRRRWKRRRFLSV